MRFLGSGPEPDLPEPVKCSGPEPEPEPDPNLTTYNSIY